MSYYLNKQAIAWALGSLKRIPRDQSGLLYFLIFNKSQTVQRGKGNQMSPFEKEFYRYFGAPIKGGAVGCFNPFDGDWMAENYINSTVYGRLLNGSHWWTNGERGFFERESANSFPANFKLRETAFSTLVERDTYPCLKVGSLLPLTALAVWYFRHDPIDVQTTNNLSGLVAMFKEEVIGSNNKLMTLFGEGGSGPAMPFQENPLTESEVLSIYPTCPFAGEPKTNVRLYVDDVELVKRSGMGVDQIADYFRKLIREKGL